jgi:excisionase family DNA binding protein
METLLTTKQVADRLGVDTKTILRYLHQGKLKGSKLGRDYRISESAVGTLLAKNDTAPAITRSAIVTAVVNQKGGVGKTTTVFNLGVALQRAVKIAHEDAHFVYLWVSTRSDVFHKKLHGYHPFAEVIGFWADLWSD